MLRKLIYFIHIGVLCTGSEKVGYDYFPELEGFLKLHEESTDWRTARINCHNEDALLASPWTPKFASTISKLQSTKYPSLPVLYSGAGLRANSAGVALRTCGRKRCRVFYADGTMGKVTCDNKLPYACYAPKLGCGNGYEMNSQTGQCYKFHDDAKSAPEAKDMCRSEGGFLAKISDSTEQAVLQTMSDGLTFIENDNGGPDFRHLTKSGYSDYSCAGPHTFICEKTGATTFDLRD